MSGVKVKHKARGVDPRIVALADKLGLPLYRRAKEIWLDGDIQLTFRYAKRHGETHATDDEERVAIACGIMQDIIDARASFGTVKERFDKLVERIENDKGKYRPMNFMYLREPSLDAAILFRGGGSTIWIELVGLPKWEVHGATFDVCLEKIRRDGPKQFGFKEGA